MSNATKVSKLSLHTMKAVPKRNSVEKEKPVLAGVIYGVATKHDIAETGFGESVRFHGNFEGVNAAGGLFRSSKAFLSGQSEEALIDALDSVPDGVGIEFSFQYTAVHSERGNLGYQYAVEMLRPISPADSLGHLRDVALKALASVPAPVHNEPAANGSKGKGSKAK